MAILVARNGNIEYKIPNLEEQKFIYVKQMQFQCFAQHFVFIDKGL